MCICICIYKCFKEVIADNILAQKFTKEFYSTLEANEITVVGTRIFVTK